LKKEIVIHSFQQCWCTQN